MHTLSLGADYQATEKLNLNLGAMYNLAESSMNDFDLTLPFAPDPLLGNGTTLLNFYSAFPGRIGLIENYSDLEYEQIELSLGGTYNITDNLYTTALAVADIFDSEEDYVYGDEGGTVYSGYLGVGYKF